MADISGLRQNYGSRDISNAITDAGPTEQSITDALAPNAFTRGLRAGGAGLTAGAYAREALNAELKGDKAGAAAARQLAMEAAQRGEANAPKINTLSKIGGVGDLLSYGAGQLGQAVPAVAPVLGGAALGRIGLRGVPSSVLGSIPGLSTVGTMAGAALPTYGMEKGSAALEQYQDPVAAALSPEQRNANATKRALINTALNTIVPTQAVAGLGGNLAKTALGRVGMTAAEQAALSAGSTKVAQHYRSELNPNRDTSQDQEELLNAAASGGIASLPFGGLHAAHDMAERAKATGGNFLDTFAKPKSDTIVADAEHLKTGDENVQPGNTPEDTVDNLIFDRKARAEKTQQYAEGIMADPDAPEFMKDKVAGMNGDYENPLNQASVGTYVGTKVVAEKAQSAYKDLTDRLKGLTEPKEGKASEQNTKVTLALEDTIKDHLHPGALQDPEIRNNLPQLAQAMARAVTKGGDLSLADVRALGHDTLPSLFEDPKAAMADIAKTLKTKDSFTPRFESSGLAETDSMSPKSMLLHSLTPENRATATPDHIQQLARFVDDLALHGVPEGKKEGINLALRSAFGTDESANAVIDHFRKRAEAKGLIKEKGGVYESRPTKDVVHADEADFQSNKPQEQNLPEREAPKSEYVLPGDNKRPLVDPDQLREARRQAIGKFADAHITEVPFKEHIEAAGGDIKAEAQKLRTSLEKRAKSGVSGAQEDHALAKRLSDDQLVDTFKVLKVEGKEPNELRATDADLQSMRQAMDKLGSAAVEGNFSFSRESGPDIHVNAESLWKHMADKVKAGESEVSGDKGRIANLFMEGVRSIMARDEVTGIRGGDIPDSTVLDHKTGMTWGDVKPSKEVAHELINKKDNFQKLEARTNKMKEMLQSDNPTDVFKARETLMADKAKLGSKLGKEKDPVQRKVLEEALLKYERLEESTKEDRATAAESEITNRGAKTVREKPGEAEESFDAQVARNERERERSPNETQQSMDPTKFAGKWKGSQANIDTINRITSPELLNRMLSTARSEYPAATPERRLQLGQLAEQINRRLINPKAEAVKTEVPKPTKETASIVDKIISGDKDLLAQIDKETDESKLNDMSVAIDKALPIDPKNEFWASRELPKDIEAVEDRIASALDRIDKRFSESEEKYSNQRTGPESMKPEEKEQILKEAGRILGPKIEVIFEKDPLFSGMFSKSEGKEILRIGVHAMNPMQVAWHESMHGIMSRLTGEKGKRGARETLQKAAESPYMVKRLEKLLADHPGALKQIKNDREERLAYMYQFWAAGVLKIGPDTHGVFQKIADFVRKLIGAVSESGKVERLFEAIHEGKFAEPSTIAEVLHDLKAETISDKIKRIGGPVYEGYSKLFTAGVDQVHQMNLPALTQLMDMFHTPPEREEQTGAFDILQRNKGHTLGFMEAKDKVSAQFTNHISDMLKDVPKEVERLAVDALEELRVPTDPRAKKVYDQVRAFYEDSHKYAKDAEVRRFDPETKQWVDLGYEKDYFSRVWDRSAMRNDEEGFLALFRKYVSPEQARKTFEMLTQGSGFADPGEKEGNLGYTPAAAFVKDRVFKFINKDNAHEFSKYQKKDLVDILHTYAMQLAHRGEYTRRFGNDGELIRRKLLEAKEEGATADELARASKVIQALEGTLGYDMNPRLRELYAGLTVYQNIALLPLVLMSSLIDPLGVAVRSSDMGEAWGAFKEGFKGLAKLYTGQKDLGGDYELARTMGLIDESNMLANTGNSYNGMYMSKWMKNVNNTFFKWNGMETWNDRMRIAAMQAGMRFIQRHAAHTAESGDKVVQYGHTKITEGNEHSERYMRELGLHAEGRKYIIPTNDGRIATTESQFMEHGFDAKQANIAAHTIQNALFKFVDGAVLRPSAGHRPVWGSDPHFMLIFHLKQFTYSFQNMIKRRVNYEGEHGNMVPMMALAAYVPFMMAADLARGSITGVSHPDWSMMDYISHGIARSGITGTDQFLSDAYSDAKHGSIPGTSFLGPSFEHAADTIQTVAGAHGHSWRQLLDRSTPLGPIVNPMFSAQEHD